MRIAILDDYQDVVRHLLAFAKLDGHSVTVFNHPTSGVGQLAVRLREVDTLVLIRERTRVTAQLLTRLPALQHIAQTGKVGPHLDLNACTGQRVAVTESNGYPQATAEMTWLLILAAMRRMPAYMANLYAGQWQRSVPQRTNWPLAGLGESVHGKMLGVWGYGRIGQIVATIGRAFGMRVAVHGSDASRARATEEGDLAIVDRRDFFAACDLVTLHLRLIDATRGCVRAEDLAAMKPTALLVNTSRAELVEPGALASALRAGRPGLAAVDVFEREPAAADEALLRLPNAICTPHLGFTERMSYERMLGGAFDNIVAFAAGTPINVANPAALGAR
jgi:D-3-phosphoglycerate dehydrogenase